MITILVFAQLSETLNINTLNVDLDHIQKSGSITIMDLKNHLYHLDNKWQVLANSAILSSINHDLSHDYSKITAGDEIAFFPPVTGG